MFSILIFAIATRKSYFWIRHSAYRPPISSFSNKSCPLPPPLPKKKQYWFVWIFFLFCLKLLLSGRVFFFFFIFWFCWFRFCDVQSFKDRFIYSDQLNYFRKSKAIGIEIINNFFFAFPSSHIYPPALPLYQPFFICFPKYNSKTNGICRTGGKREKKYVWGWTP